MNQPWDANDATLNIRKIANDPRFSLAYKLHAKERLAERSIITSDVLHVLKKGFVFAPPRAATQKGRYKYEIQSKTPNSGGREIRLVAIPCEHNCIIKLVTVMWVDESSTRAGTLSGE